jgi:hypothetical protein
MMQNDGSWVMYHLFHPEALQGEWQRIQSNMERKDFRIQAFEDAQQWDIIYDDTGLERIMWISSKTGEIRTGADGCDKWVIQDDGQGFPSFYNTETDKVEYDDPRFEPDVGHALQATRDYVMSEMRYAMYFCKRDWEEYNELAQQPKPDQKKMDWVAKRIATKGKYKHMSSFLTRAKALFAGTSVVDRPLDPNTKLDLEYADWLGKELERIVDYAVRKARDVRDVKRKVVWDLRAKAQRVWCLKCTRETQRHLDYCALCGVKQLDFVWERSEEGQRLLERDVQAVSVAPSGGGGRGGRGGEEASAALLAQEEALQAIEDGSMGARSQVSAAGSQRSSKRPSTQPGVDYDDRGGLSGNSGYFNEQGEYQFAADPDSDARGP